MADDLRTGDIVMVRLPDQDGRETGPGWYGVLVDAIKQQDARGYNVIPAFYCVRLRHDTAGEPTETRNLWVEATRITSYEALRAWGGPVEWVEKELIQS